MEVPHVTCSNRSLAQVPGLARFIYLFVVALSLHTHYELSVPKEMPYADLDLYCKVYWVCDVVFTLTSQFISICVMRYVQVEWYFFRHAGGFSDLSGGHAHIRWGVHMCPISFFVNVLLILCRISPLFIVMKKVKINSPSVPSSG